MAIPRKRTRDAVPLPDWVAPQLALLVEEPPSGPQWAHEIKYDGYRLHARIDHGEVRLLTRTGLDWTQRYEATARALAVLPVETAYIDGELCALRADGTTSFAALQAATERGRPADLVYFAFDLLHLDGEDLTSLPLAERKARLQRILENAGAGIRYAEHIAANGRKFYDAACKLGVEGIVSKRLDARYAPGNRGLWRKVKCYHEEEFVIVGFSDPEGSRAYLGALLLGYYADDGRLIYAGRAGTGLSDAELRRLHEKLMPLVIRKMPLDAPPPRTSRFGSPRELSRVHWVRPELVCEVRYVTWTADGLLRHVVYQGLREDKPAKEVRRELPRR